MPDSIKKSKTCPLIPLRGLTVFPNMVIHFDVGRPASTLALEKAMAEDQKVFLVTQKDANVDEPARKDLEDIGTVATIRQVLNLPGDNLRVLCEGETRGRIRKIHAEKEGYLRAEITVPREMTPKEPRATALVMVLRSQLERYAETGSRIAPEVMQSLSEVTEPGVLADIAAANVLTRLEDRQAVLDAVHVEDRLEKLSLILMRETELAALQNEIQQKLKVQVDKNQKDYYLREQIKAIQDELGEKDPGDVDDLETRLKETPVSDEAREKIQKELERIGRMAPGMPEIAVSRTWVEWILDMPWGKYTEDNLDIGHAREVLDEDHYAMEKVKERVIEFLAVRQVREKAETKVPGKAPILCFVGPPGVGKTSIVKAIAKAVGRKYVRMSLGGVRDEAEIRGHRRTYVGAIPGRIINGMKLAGSMNPLFLFDEIDKMSSDFRGDPASAMLEVLDGEQNDHFRDHYLEVAFDLSKVMFITTANTVETIPGPLLDRMEVIEVPSYTEEEKLHIAMKHLLPKQIQEHGLKKGQVQVSEAVMQKIIENFTREAGVRELERTIGSVVRKSVVDMLEHGLKKVTVNEEKLHAYLGAAKYLREPPEKEPLVGVVNGLAYTTVGGETLTVECTVMPGTGQLQLTGQLGDVMKESAKAALSYVRANGEKWGIRENFIKETDIHIHVPEGAIPKDGPSAGVTMVSAMVSALSGHKCRQDVAMTGEITLRGRVLPIGGVKEKLLAAFRAGLRVIVLPRENDKDLEEIPENVLKTFEIHEASHIEDVLNVVLA